MHKSTEKRLAALEEARMKREMDYWEAACDVAEAGLTWEQRRDFEAFCRANEAQPYDQQLCMAPDDAPGEPCERPAWCLPEWVPVCDTFSRAFWPVYRARGGTYDAMPFPLYEGVNHAHA